MRANGIYTRAVSGSTRADRNDMRADGIYTRAVSGSTRADRNGERANGNCIGALGFELFGRHTSGDATDGVYLRPALRSPCFLDQIQPIRQNRPIKPPPSDSHTDFGKN